MPLVLGPWQDYNALPVMCIGVLVFRFFENLSYSRFSPAAGKVIAKLSQWTLGAYLVSWIFDQMFYPLLDAAAPAMAEKAVWFPVVVLAVCFCSLALSAVLNLVYDLGASLFVKIRKSRTSIS